MRKSDAAPNRVGLFPGSSQVTPLVTHDGLLKGCRSRAERVGRSFPYALAFSPDSKWVLSGGKAITAWDTTNWKKGAGFKGHKHEILSCGFAPNGVFFTGSGENHTPADWSVRRWHPKTGAETGRWKLDDPIQSIGISPRGDRVAVGTLRGQLAMIDPSKAGEKAFLWRDSSSTDTINRLVFDPKGETLYVVGEGELGVVRRFDVATGKAQAPLKTGASARGFWLSKDGKTAALARSVYGVGTPERVQVLELPSGKVLWETAPLSSLPINVAMTADLKTLVVLLNNPNEIQIFDQV